MLSRVADALFWMSRYLERAECTARLLDVFFHLELDLHGVLAGAPELHWSSVGAILRQATPPPRNGSASPQTAMTHWLTFATENPNSIMNCVSRARYNARQIRGTINSEMWKELNKLYWQLCDTQFRELARESPHDFHQAVECGHHMFQGVCDATLTHDEGWQFIQLGKLLERADKTLSILDNQYQLLRDFSDPSDLPLTNLQWAAVLKSCCAFEAYQRLYVGRVEPERVVEFLLLHPNFPRSVRFSLEAAGRALKAIQSPSPDGALSKAERIMGRVLSDLEFAELDAILHDKLHAFLGSVTDRCNQVSRAVQEQHSIH